MQLEVRNQVSVVDIVEGFQDKLLGHGLQLIAGARKSFGTKQTYTSNYRHFIEYCEDNDGTFSPATLESYLAEMEENFSPSTVNGRRQAVVFVAKQAMTELGRIIADNQEVAFQRGEIERQLQAMKHVAGVKAENTTVAEWYSREFVKDLLATTDGRDRLIISIGMLMGLRISEIARLERKDFVVIAGYRQVNVVGKGGKKRTVPVHDIVWEQVESMRGKLFDVGPRMMHKICTGYDVKPHSMRRTAASLMYDARPDVVAISKILGHGDIKTTMRYLNYKLDMANNPVHLITL